MSQQLSAESFCRSACCCCAGDASAKGVLSVGDTNAAEGDFSVGDIIGEGGIVVGDMIVKGRNGVGGASVQDRTTVGDPTAKGDISIGEGGICGGNINDDGRLPVGGAHVKGGGGAPSVATIVDGVGSVEVIGGPSFEIGDMLRGDEIASGESGSILAILRVWNSSPRPKRGRRSESIVIRSSAGGGTEKSSRV